MSSELRTARQAVAATISTLGFDPVSQDDFPSGHGELRQWLRVQVDSCEGLVQLVGQAYGAEPREVDPDYGRVSYTQFEFLHARREGKKTWVIIVGRHCHRDTRLEELDLPAESGHPDPAGFQAERGQLQQKYVERLQGENHLWHQVGNELEMQNVVLRLRDELGSLRRQTERQQRRLTRGVVALLVGLVLLGVGGWWGYQRLRQDVRQAGMVDSVRIRAHLLQTVEETHGRELAEAEAAADWKQRQQLREGAEAAHAARLSRVDALTASFAEIEGRGGATSVFQEMTRILTEQGVDEAISFVSSQRFDIMQTVQARTTVARERNRADLQPLLKAAMLHESKGLAAEARSLYTDILAAEPDWPDALHAAFWFHTSQGDAALLYATLPTARQEFEAARLLAQRHVSGSPDSTQARWDLGVSYERLGEVAMQAGDLDAARASFQKRLALSRALAEADPTDARAQRDVGTSFNWLGDLSMQEGDLDAARESILQSMEISRRLVQAEPSNAQSQRDLSISFSKLGEVAMRAGDLKAALESFQQDMEISRRLAQVEPANVQAQRDLGTSYSKLGEVALQVNDLKFAGEAFREGMAIRERLAQADPTSTQARRELGRSYERLGVVAMRVGELKIAQEWFRQHMDICQHLAQADPTNAQAQRDAILSYDRIGSAVLLLGELEQARGYFRMALVLAEEHVEVSSTPEAWNLCCWFSLLAGDFAHARDAALAGLQLQPGQLMLQSNLASAYMYLGENAKAEAIHLQFKDRRIPGGRTWKQAVADDYAILRKLGQAHPQMREVEAMLGLPATNPSRL